jgi:hypothetical protein
VFYYHVLEKFGKGWVTIIIITEADPLEVPHSNTLKQEHSCLYSERNEAAWTIKKVAFSKLLII